MITAHQSRRSLTLSRVPPMLFNDLGSIVEKKHIARYLWGEKSYTDHFADILLDSLGAQEGWIMENTRSSQGGCLSFRSLKYRYSVSTTTCTSYKYFASSALVSISFAANCKQVKWLTESVYSEGSNATAGWLVKDTSSGGWLMNVVRRLRLSRADWVDKMSRSLES